MGIVLYAKTCLLSMDTIYDENLLQLRNKFENMRKKTDV